MVPDEVMAVRGGEDIIKKEIGIYERERLLEEKEKKVAEREWQLRILERRQTAAQIDQRETMDGVRGKRYAARHESTEAAHKFDRSTGKVVKLETEMQSLQKQLRLSQRVATALEERLNRREQDIKAVQDGSIRVGMEHGLTRALLGTRTSEPEEARSFPAADTLSGVELSSMTEGLNAEILQVAAIVADMFDFGVKVNTGEELTAARTTIGGILGPTMLQLLSSVRHCEDPLVVQIALQSCMTKFAEWAIVAWHLDMSRDQSILMNIYSEMQRAGKSQKL